MRASFPPLRFCFNLPLEIVELILDHLSCEEIRSLRRHFSLRVSDSYWRLRSPKDVFFEVQNVNPDSLDWEYFRLEGDQLLHTSESLQSRKCILLTLKDLKETLLDILNTRA